VWIGSLVTLSRAFCLHSPHASLTTSTCLARGESFEQRTG
jgi:hypothetical protein